MQKLLSSLARLSPGGCCGGVAVGLGGGVLWAHQPNPCVCFAPPPPPQDGLRRCVNAVDLVYAVTALLECGSKKGPAAHFGDHTDKFWWVAGGGLAGGKVAAAGAGAAAGRGGGCGEEAGAGWMCRAGCLVRFAQPCLTLLCNRCTCRRAYHALSWGSDGGELRAGLDMAKKVQRALVNGEPTWGRHCVGANSSEGCCAPPSTPAVAAAAWLAPPQRYTPLSVLPPPHTHFRPADGGAVLQQHHYHNFKQFRIYDLSDHKMNAQHLIVSVWGCPRVARMMCIYQSSQQVQPHDACVLAAAVVCMRKRSACWRRCAWRSTGRRPSRASHAL